MKTKEIDECASVGHEGFYYKVYGLTLRTNQALPGLIATSATAPVDVEVNLAGDEPSQQQPLITLDQDMEPRFDWQIQPKADGNYYQLSYRSYGTLDVEITPTGRQIWATWTNALLEEVTAILLGCVLGTALRLQGTTCLHASVIGVGQRAIAIIGDKGAGKSTTAAALAKRGHAILSDDVAVLTDCTETFLVQPGYPRLRLWKSAVNALYGSEEGLSRVFRPVEKHFVELHQHGESAWRFHPKPLPLAAIYVLRNRQLGLAAPCIDPISSQMGLMQLMAHRYPHYLTLDRDRQAKEFALLSRLAATVPIKQVHRSDDLTKLPEVCEVILNDLEGLSTKTQPKAKSLG